MLYHQADSRYYDMFMDDLHRTMPGNEVHAAHKRRRWRKLIFFKSTLLFFFSFCYVDRLSQRIYGVKLPYYTGFTPSQSGESTMLTSTHLIARFTLLCSLVALLSLTAPHQGFAVDTQEIDAEVAQVLRDLYATVPEARTLRDDAVGILVFPDILKAGLLIGGQAGNGSLIKNGQTVGYYNSTAASYGLQAGVQSFGYVLFFMNDEALSYLDKSAGWEIGIGPSIVVVDSGAAGTLTTTTGRDDIYAFIFNQKGLMAGAGIQGSKITKIQ